MKTITKTAQVQSKYRLMYCTQRLSNDSANNTGLGYTLVKFKPYNIISMSLTLSFIRR